MALEDTREFGQRPKLDPYGDHVLLVFYTARATGDPTWPAEPLEVHIYLSGGFIVTVRRDECTALDELHAQLADEPARTTRRCSSTASSTRLTDAYYPVIEAIEEQVDALEGEVLDPPAARAPPARLPAQAVRARAAPARRRPARPVPGRARGDPRARGLQAGSRPYLRDIGDHLVQIAGEFQRQIDDLTSLTQTYFNANSDRLNGVATRLTIGGTLFVICTVVTGFFGQNFGWLVDNIDTKQDFLIYGVGGITIPTVILLTLFWVKRRDWF